MKRLLSVFLCLSMFLPAFCISTYAVSDISSSELPPWVEDGEIWHPADGIMTIEDDGCPKSHFPPAGYVYQGYSEGNTVFDVAVTSGIAHLIGVIPGIGTIVKIIDAVGTLEWLLPAVQGGRVKTTYYKYVYTNGNLYWHHYYWYYRSNTDGLFRYLDCEVRTNA